jgi:hypothetical protein
VKLNDFGIARTAADPSLTQTGLVTGSPAYLAPEVAAGGRGDEAVDVWSLGATAYHVLSGHPPYDFGDNMLGGLYRLVNEEPPRLADAGWMAPMLEGTMAKDPSRRWTMTQVRDFLAGPDSGLAPPSPTPTVPLTPPRVEETRTTQVAAPTPAGAPPRRPPRAPLNTMLAGVLALALALVLGLVLYAVLPDQEPTEGSTTQSPAAGPEESASSRPTEAAEPTARGMKAFVRDYVAAISTDPDTAWTMLTPKFQAESGGLAKYRDFWSGVGDGEILGVSADPDTLVVSYRVRFDNFGTGRRPTVLDLVYDGDRYLIDGERTTG